MFTLAEARRRTGLAYIGSVNSSSKIIKNQKKNTLTYILYLAPHSLSGYNVCPKATESCRMFCLNGSGHAKIDTTGRILAARIKKTKLFYEDREFFMQWLIKEIDAARRKAHAKGMEFSVRLNGTSDISPLMFKYEKLDILQWFPSVQFYDYTKVANRMRILQHYPNYDLTFSYSGENWSECREILKAGGRVSVVFENHIPIKYRGYTVLDGDYTDLRYLDAEGVIIGLKFKRTKQPLTEKQTFIVRQKQIIHQ